MIYTGNDSPNDSKTAAAQPQRPNAQTSRSAQPPPPPPAYENYRHVSQSQPPHPYPYVVSADSALLYPRHDVGDRTRQRFLRAFISAGVIWILLTVFLQSLRMTVQWRDHLGLIDSWDYSIPSEVELETCVQGGDWTAVPNPGPGDYFRYAAETSFDLTLSSDTLFFLSRGDRLGGAVKVKTSTNQAKDTASVHVLIRYRSPLVSERTKACWVTRSDNENGVGLFAPVFRREHPGNEFSLSYEMSVTLPEHSSPNPLIIKNFETDIPNSSHNIADLGTKVLFESISLKGTNARIQAESVTAHVGDILTTNGRISGAFSTNEALRLTTTNAAIAADVTLISDSTESRPRLQAKTTNGRLNSDISLISKAKNSQGGVFQVSTVTTNAQLDVKFPKSPVDSALDFTASTTNGRASVSLNPAYEGTFDLHTSSYSKVNIDEHHVEDPSGKNRKRRVRYTHANKYKLVGDISWDAENYRRGSVVVSTSNSALEFTI